MLTENKYFFISNDEINKIVRTSNNNKQCSQKATVDKIILFTEKYFNQLCKRTSRGKNLKE
jgi:hypothetical protein